MGDSLYRFIRVQLVNINLVRFLEFLFELLTDWYDVSILDDLLRELVQKFLLGHWIKTVKVSQLAESWVLSQLVVIGFIDHIDRFQWDTLRVLYLKIVWEVAIENV